MSRNDAPDLHLNAESVIRMLRLMSANPLISAFFFLRCANKEEFVIGHVNAYHPCRVSRKVGKLNSHHEYVPSGVSCLKNLGFFFDQ